jgi:hypothetical protein
MVEVLAVHNRLTLCCVSATPVPVTVSATGEFVALLLSERLPEVAPPACGVKVTVKLALCPAFNVRGNVSPVSENSALVDAAAEMVTPAPLALTVPVRFELVPTVTLPKAALAGVTLSCPGLDPEPDSAMLKFDPAVVNARPPVTDPAACGVNVMLNVRLCPAFRVIGTFSPLVVNPVPVNDMFEMVRLDPPEFVMISDLV